MKTDPLKSLRRFGLCNLINFVLKPQGGRIKLRNRGKLTRNVERTKDNFKELMKFVKERIKLLQISADIFSYLGIDIN